MRNPSPKEKLFERVLEENERRLAAIARTYAQGDDTSDLYQEILLQLWRSIDSYQARSKLTTWVYRIALYTAIAFKRRDGRHVETSTQPSDGPTRYIPCRAEPRSEVAILEEFLKSLSEADRAIFLLFLDDIGYREMSEVTGLGEAHLRVKISRLKKSFMERYIGT